MKKHKSKKPAVERTHTGKGTLVEKNPMVGQKERSHQLNNLGKHGEPLGERVTHIQEPKNI
ncbi:MAG TPA: hypothetical protein VK174_07520 [Chitinophagales bacterium]|nr:hypothetical protein [Chitinophagales bacterium]